MSMSWSNEASGAEQVETRHMISNSGSHSLCAIVTRFSRDCLLSSLHVCEHMTYSVKYTLQLNTSVPSVPLSSSALGVLFGVCTSLQGAFTILIAWARHHKTIFSQTTETLNMQTCKCKSYTVYICRVTNPVCVHSPLSTKMNVSLGSYTKHRTTLRLKCSPCLAKLSVQKPKGEHDSFFLLVSIPCLEAERCAFILSKCISYGFGLILYSVLMDGYIWWIKPCFDPMYICHSLDCSTHDVWRSFPFLLFTFSTAVTLGWQTYVKCLSWLQTEPARILNVELRGQMHN